MLLALVCVPVLVISQTGGLDEFTAKINLKNPQLLDAFTDVNR